MILARRIVVLWILVIGAFLASFALPHYSVTKASFISYSIQVLLFILSVYLVKFEKTKKTKFVFVNFAIFFGISLFFHLYNFVGTLFFTDNPILARLMYFQYISAGAYSFLLAFSICYITVDALFRDFKIYQKYVLAFTIVGGFFTYYYLPFFQDSNYLYTTKEIEYWRELSSASSTYESEFGIVPTKEELKSHVMMNGELPMLSRLSDAEAGEVVEALHPYLAGSNYIVLVFQPVFRNVIYMCVLSVGLILLFFGYLYKKDPPQGAYIDKMMFFLLMFSTLEIFHAWSFIKTVEWQSSLQFIEIGQVLSSIVLAIVAVCFALRLRFITTVYGEFYEHEIVESPATVTRWRDSLDNLVLAHFFGRNELVGRFLVDPKTKR